MSNLTGQQIKDTYEGLLNLQDSTNGITSSYQQIQDGLGNNTNTRISTQGIISPNVVGMGNQILKADYYGNGFASGTAVPPANGQNRTLFQPFYDSGNFSYSGISYNLGTLSSTSDVVNVAFYTAQFVPLVGYAPKDLIMSGITFESVAPSTTGIKTTLLPSTLSFSGTGGGFFIAAFYVANAGVTPTVRYGTPLIQVANQAYAYNLGYVLNSTNNGLNVATKYATSFNIFSAINLPFQSTYTTTDISSNIITTLTYNAIGFGLRPI